MGKADPAPRFGALTAEGPFPKPHISPRDFFTPSRSRFILNSKRGLGRTVLVPEARERTQALCQHSWLDLLRRGQTSISLVAGIFSQEAASLFTALNPSSVKGLQPYSWVQCSPFLTTCLCWCTSTSRDYKPEQVSQFAGCCHLSMARAGQPLL